MTTGHIGAEYVEYVLRHNQGRSPDPAPLNLNDPALDGIRIGEPDLAFYDEQLRKTPDPGEPPEEKGFHVQRNVPERVKRPPFR